jgi:serine/threonine protein phosphatase PrpC
MQQQSTAKGTSLRVIAAGRSDIGCVRAHNEDTIALCEPEDHTLLAQWGRLYVLADGAGGHAAGEVASRTAVETISTVYYQPMVSPEAIPVRSAVKHLNGPLEDVALPATRIEYAFLMAHARLQELSALRPEYVGMATTCLAAIVKGPHILLAHAGDSRVYLVRPGTASAPAITCLTDDHSMAAEFMRHGILSSEQARQSASRHTVLRLLGGGIQQPPPSPDLLTCIAQPGDRLLLCCDGLWSMVSEEQIAQVVSRHTPQEACDKLIWLANEAGGEDNISAVVLAFV